MHALAKLSLLLTAICVFIPILILSITNGFQYFALEKLQNFYSPYSLKLEQPIDGKTIKNPQIIGFYEDFILLKGTKQEAPSLIRVLEYTNIKNWKEKKQIKLISGNIPKNHEIFIGESLAMQMGLNVGDQVQSFLFSPTSPTPMRSSTLTVSGIFSFENASLDRVVSLILPETLESNFFIDQHQVNLLASYNSSELKTLKTDGDQLLELAQTPSVKQMNQQHNLLLLLVIASSFLCFFSLYMNLKTNMSYNIYSMSVIKILGLETTTVIRIFFLQNIVLMIFGILLGFLLCISIIPYISQIINVFEVLCNFFITLLKEHFIIFKDLQEVQFLPTDIFYIQSIPVKIKWQDFSFVLSILTIGILLMNKIYYSILIKNPLLTSLKMEQGV